MKKLTQKERINRLERDLIIFKIMIFGLITVVSVITMFNVQSDYKSDIFVLDMLGEHNQAIGYLASSMDSHSEALIEYGDIITGIVMVQSGHANMTLDIEGEYNETGGYSCSINPINTGDETEAQFSAAFKQ